MATEILNLGGIRDRSQQCILDIWWKDRRYEYDGSSNLIYTGSHRLHDAPTDDSEWVVVKYTWDGSSNLIRTETLVGSWDTRALLAWGA